MKTTSKLEVIGVYEFEIFDAQGNLVRRGEGQNKVVNVGLDYLRDYAFVNGLPGSSAWYIGLTDGSPTIAAGDTMASHPGWVEVAAYDEAVRQTWNKVATGTAGLTNNASKALFSMNASTTVGGLFLVNVNTKSGTTGTLMSAFPLTGGNAELQVGWTLQVGYTLSLAAL